MAEEREVTLAERLRDIRAEAMAARIFGQLSLQMLASLSEDPNVMDIVEAKVNGALDFSEKIQGSDADYVELIRCTRMIMDRALKKMRVSIEQRTN